MAFHCHCNITSHAGGSTAAHAQGIASGTWSHWFLPAPSQCSRGDRVAFRGDSVSLVTTRWQSRHRNSPPPQGDLQGLSGCPCTGDHPGWPVPLPLLARASHCSSHTQSLWRPDYAINCAWKPGTELPKGKGKWRKMHDQPGGAQLQDGEYLETPKASRGKWLQLWREFPVSYFQQT